MAVDVPVLPRPTGEATAQSADATLVDFYLGLAQRIDLWYNIIGRVLLCTRFPIPFKGAGATSRDGKLNNLRTVVMFLLTLVLFAFGAMKGGVMNLLCAIAIEFGVYFAIKVGSRVQSRT